MEEVQTGWYRCPVWSLVSEGLCRWRSVQHIIVAATPMATSAGRTSSTLLMFESPASTQLWAPWLPRKSSMLRAMLHLFHFSFSSKLLFAILFIDMSVSSQQSVNFLREERIESCLKIFFESFHSSPSPLWVSTVNYVISSLDCCSALFNGLPATISATLLVFLWK